MREVLSELFYSKKPDYISSPYEVRDLDNGWYEVRGGHGVLWTDKNWLDKLNESMKKSFDELKEANEDSIILVEFDK